MAEARERLEKGRALMTAGRAGEAAATFRAALDALDDPTSEVAVELRVEFVTAGRIIDRFRAEALAELDRLVDEGLEATTDATRHLYAEKGLALIRAGGAREEAVRLLRQAVPPEDEELDEHSVQTLLPTLIHSFNWLDEFHEAAHLAQRTMATARRVGSVTAFATAGAFGAVGLYMRGLIREAESYGQQALDAVEKGWKVAIPFAATFSAYAAMERDELGDAERYLSYAEGRGFEGTTQWPFFLEARARLALIRGDLDAAEKDLREAGRLMRDLIRTDNPTMLGWRSRLARTLAARGAMNEACELAEEELEHARRFGAPRALATALRVLGELKKDDGLSLLEEAWTTIEDSPAQLERAYCLLALGRAINNSGDRERARILLTDALMIGERQGSLQIEKAARYELRAAGARRRREAATGVPALTPGELRVARLAATGMSNPEVAEALFVSTKAIEWHLKHAYRKLAISSRRQLRDALGDYADPAND